MGSHQKSLEAAIEQLQTLCGQPLVRQLAAGVVVAEEAAVAAMGPGTLESLLGAGMTQNTADGMTSSFWHPEFAVVLPPYVSSCPPADLRLLLLIAVQDVDWDEHRFF